MDIRADKALRIAALLHDIGKPAAKTTDEDGVDHFYGHVELSEEMAAKILKRLKFDNDTLNKVRKYIRFHDYQIVATPKAVRRAMNKIGVEYFAQVMEIKQADVKAQSSYQREEKEARWQQVQQLYQERLQKAECVTIKDLAINGTDLIRLGVAQGKEIGEVLNQLLQEVLDAPEKNTVEYLTAQVENYRK